MSEGLTQTKIKKEESSFFTLIKGIGCFFLISSFISIIILFISYFSLKPMISAIKKDDAPPPFDNPTEQDFWDLKDKIEVINSANNNESIINGLSHSQYNAFLSSIKSPPISLFCLHKVRHYSENKILRYYLIGSGFMLKKFNISFIIDSDKKENSLKEFKINNWKVPSNSWQEKYLNYLVKQISLSDKSELLLKIISGNIKPVFD